MKTLLFSLSLILFISFSGTAAAQTKSETFVVSGECGMCKKKIETAAKEAGATYAVWNVESKKLAVKYDSKTTSTAKIQQGIAQVGYDTPAVAATEEAYKSLHECCQYERAAKLATTDSVEKTPVAPKQ